MRMGQNKDEKISTLKKSIGETVQEQSRCQSELDLNQHVCSFLVFQVSAKPPLNMLMDMSRSCTSSHHTEERSTTNMPIESTAIHLLLAQIPNICSRPCIGSIWRPPYLSIKNLCMILAMCTGNCRQQGKKVSCGA